MSEEKRTDLESLGEFGTIDLLTKNFLITRESTALGIGDDAAVLERNEEQFTLISTDMLVEGVHFNLMYVPFKHWEINWKFASMITGSELITASTKKPSLKVITSHREWKLPLNELI